MNFAAPNPANSNSSAASKGPLEAGSVASHMANEINNKLDELGITPKINLDAIAAASKGPQAPGMSESLQQLLAKENGQSRSSINIQL